VASPVGIPISARGQRRDLQAAMEQGGWRDVESMMGYIHDVPVERRQLIDNLPIGETRGRDISEKIA
jgi:hypothetical protein